MLVKKLVAGVSFLGGLPSDGEATSELFKLQKVRTLEKDIPSKKFFRLIIIL